MKKGSKFVETDMLDQYFWSYVTTIGGADEDVQSRIILVLSSSTMFKGPPPQNKARLRVFTAN